MIPLLAHALWALLAIRLLCWRATVSTLTLLKYIAAGAFISFTVAAPLFKAVNPYAEPSAWLSFAWNLLLTFLLLVPVLAALRGKGSVRTLSVADGFLLAYVVGFGYDLMTAIPGLVAKAHTATAFNLLPPGSLTDPSALLDPASAAKVTHFAGHALWLGAIALAFVTARRFLRRPFHVWLIGLAVFLFCALDQPFFWKPAPFAHAWWLATLHGSLTGWIALAALVLVQALESKWAADPQSAKEVIRHWIGNAEAIAERDFNGLSRRASEDRLRRRILVAQAESRRDSSIAFEVRKLEAQAGRVEEENVVVPSLKGIQWRGAWKSFWFWQSLLWLMLLPVLIYPASINYVIFNSVFNYHLSNLNGSVLDTALIAFLFGRYLLSPGNQTQSGAEGLLQFNVERQIFRCSLWLVTLGCLFQSWNLYFPFPSLYAWFANSSSYWPTDWTAATIRTFLLLVQPGDPPALPGRQ